MVKTISLVGIAAAAIVNPLKHERRKIWCAVMVLGAICSLTVSLATRYTFPLEVSSHGVKNFQTNSAPDVKRQRLTKNAANWVPPVLKLWLTLTPTFNPSIALARPPVPSLFFEESLYNRPPPTLQPF